MSKMSQLHAELTEQANEMGYATIEDAERDGYHMVQDLVEGTFKLEKIDEQDKAHEAWLAERQQVLSELVDVIHDDGLDWNAIVKRVEHAMEFIEKGEM